MIKPSMSCDPHLLWGEGVKKIEGGGGNQNKLVGDGIFFSFDLFPSVA